MQEYMSLMQHPSKSKTWANDDAFIPAAEDTKMQDQSADADAQDLTYAQRKRAKIADGQGDGEAQPATQEPEPMVVDATGEGATEEATEQQNPQPEEQPAVSDSDWLRSKTSRLLGLLDEDEQAEFDSAPPSAPESKPAAEASADSDDGGSPEGADDAKTPEAPPPVDTNIENIRLSARLFVRNLAYDIRESDLEPLFSPFGRIEEVSFSFFLFFSPSLYQHASLPPGCPYDDYPDRDIRCKSTGCEQEREF